MHWVKDAHYIEDYKVKIRFETDEVKIVDLYDYLEGEIFEPLKDLSYFKLFEVNKDIDTIVWPNDADFSPDFLYEIGEIVSEQASATDGVSRRR